MSRKSIKMLNAAINTDSRMFEIDSSSGNMAKKWKLAERSVMHIRITDSTHLRQTYDFREQLGHGSFGTVISVIDRQTNKDWAMKIINKNAGADKVQIIQREIQILKMVEHPHIIHLDRVFESANKIYLILERCDGELASLHKEKKSFSELETRIVIRDLADVVAYLHKHDIVHRDLKLENILITRNPANIYDHLYIKVTDFGLSIRMQGRSYRHMLHDYCGTLIYMAPEIITNHSYSQQCDVWAIGVIMYTLLGGRYPFYSADEAELCTKICKNDPSFSGFKLSEEGVHLIRKTLEKNPALRLTAAEVTLHPWIVGKSMTHDDQSSQNVLDMMRQWRSEMMLPVGSECDWMASGTQPEAFTSVVSQVSIGRDVHRESSSIQLHHNDSREMRRQQIHLAPKTIRFEKPKPRYENTADVANRRQSKRTPNDYDDRLQGNRRRSSNPPTPSKGATSRRRSSSKDNDATTRPPPQDAKFQTPNKRNTGKQFK